MERRADRQRHHAACAQLSRARPGDVPERLVWTDDSYGGFFGGLLKAADADVYAFRRERFDDSPDFFVAGEALDDAHQVTRTNPFHDDYAWGRSELVGYENEWGRPLQGALIYPADYEPGTQYPMVVYHYELLSQSLHRYVVPDATNYYNVQAWSQEGYFVLMPDIVYRDRRPGQSNVETLRPAVAAAVATGMIDPDRIGLIGHSWGGYQTTFFVTQDDLFASAVAGAPLTNLMSMYLSFLLEQRRDRRAHLRDQPGPHAGALVGRLGLVPRQLTDPPHPEHEHAAADDVRHRGRGS